MIVDYRAMCTRCDLPGHTAAMHCDDCGQRIYNEIQLEKYERLGVDWAICLRCERIGRARP